MFDFLKKKISGFIDGLTKKEEEKEPEKEEAQRIPEAEAPLPREAMAAPPEEAGPPGPEAKAAQPRPEEKTKEPQKPKAPPREEAKAAAAREAPRPAPAKELPKTQGEVKEIPRPAQKKEPSGPVKAEPPKLGIPESRTTAPKPEIPKAGPAKPETAKTEPPKPVSRQSKSETEKVEPTKTESPLTKPETPKAEPVKPGPRAEASAAGAESRKALDEVAEVRMPEAERPKERLKLSLVGAVKSFITREVEISENDVKGMAEGLELELLEADVDIGVAESIKEELMEKLIGSKIPKDRLHAYVSGSIRETLVDVLTNEKAFDIVERVEKRGTEPLKIVFLGINGAGKTTTIAKVAKLLMDKDLKLVFAAADTFRAAAIEQMGVHAERLGVKMVKREYGSDPTSVAFDAVNVAKAHGMDAVLIDTAGRQDTNISLINEMKKMDRVIKPDIKIYIGESIAGNAIIEQISAFNREIGLDAVILTKLDCDPKGGTMLSISKATGVPIIYVGVGQRYEDLERFDPAKIVERIVE